VQNVDSKPASHVDGSRLGLGVVLTLIGGIGWGFSGTCAQFLFDGYALDPRWLVCVRSMGAGIIFLIVASLFDRKNLRAAFNPRTLLRIAVFGICGVLMCQTCYLFAIQTTDAGTATVLQSLNLLIIMCVVCVQMRRRPRPKELVGVALAIAGTFLIATHGSFSSLAISPAGLAWGLGTAVAGALYILLPAKLLQEHGSIVVTGFAMLFGGVVSWAAFQPWTIPVHLDLQGWMYVAAVTVIGTVVSFACFLNGVKMVGSMLAGLLGCAEPVAACVLSALWLGTQFAPMDIVGMAMIIGMMFLMV